jgi:hypothetical protein
VTRPAAASRPPRPTPASKLRRLAARVERLGAFARRDPERQLAEQEAIIAALRTLADELEIGP